MRELIFSEKFALIVLNKEEGITINSNKKALLKCIAAACIIELYLDNSFVFDEGVLSVTEDDLKQNQITKYQRIVLNAILKKRKVINDKFIMCIKEVVSLRSKTLKNIESLYICALDNVDSIEEKTGLLNYNGLNKYKNNIMELYYTKEELYLNLVNELRYGVLETEDISEENIFMMWLLRESGMLNNIFTKDDLIKIENKISHIRYNNTLSSKILRVNIQRNIKNKIRKVIKNNDIFYI